jgi:hypothetical protein
MAAPARSAKAAGGGSRLDQLDRRVVLATRSQSELLGVAGDGQRGQHDRDVRHACEDQEALEPAALGALDLLVCLGADDALVEPRPRRARGAGDVERPDVDAFVPYAVRHEDVQRAVERKRQQDCRQGQQGRLPPAHLW